MASYLCCVGALRRAGDLAHVAAERLQVLLDLVVLHAVGNRAQKRAELTARAVPAAAIRATCCGSLIRLLLRVITACAARSSVRSPRPRARGGVRRVLVVVARVAAASAAHTARRTRTRSAAATASVVIVV